MKATRMGSLLAAAFVCALAATLASAQTARDQQIQTTGEPGSPSATTTLSGKQLPAPDPSFGGVIAAAGADVHARAGEDDGGAARAEVSSGEALVLGVCAIAVVFLGFFPNWGTLPIFGDVHVLDWARESVSQLFSSGLS